MKSPHGGEEVRIKYSFDPTPHMALRGYVTNEEHAEMVNNISYLLSEIIEDIQSKMFRYLCFGACFMTCGGFMRDDSSWDVPR